VRSRFELQFRLTPHRQLGDAMLIVGGAFGSHWLQAAGKERRARRQWIAVGATSAGLRESWTPWRSLGCWPSPAVPRGRRCAFDTSPSVLGDRSRTTYDECKGTVDRHRAQPVVHSSPLRSPTNYGRVSSLSTVEIIRMVLIFLRIFHGLAG